MDVGLIGAGNIGATLARMLTEAGHTVRLGNSRGPDTIRDLAADVGAKAVAIGEAVEHVDLIVIAIPFGAVERLPKNLFDDVADTTVVVDAGNYYPGLRDGRNESIEAGLPESVWVAQTLDRPVLKAFNSISFTSLAQKGRSPGDPDRIALPVAGDSVGDKARLIALLDELGFDGVDAGALAQSWRQRPGTPAYCTDLDRPRLVQALAMADRDCAPERRDMFIAQMLPLVRAGNAVDLVALGRSIYGAP